MLLFEWPVLSEMISDVEAYANERCGFFFGHEAGESKVITRIMPVANRAASGDEPGAYKISTKAYQHAEASADAYGTKLLGVYHSHPNRPAIPSQYDLEAAQPNFIYIIISVYNKKMREVRCWQLNEFMKFEEVMIDFIPASKSFITQSEELLEFQ